MVVSNAAGAVADRVSNVRAAIVVTDTRRGGTPIRMATVARSLQQRGWEILFVSVMPAGPVLDDLRQEGLAVATLELSSFTGLPKALLRLRRLLRVWKPDLVQTALWHANTLGRLCATGTGVPVISGYQSLDDVKPRTRIAIDRATSRLAAAHVCVSSAVANRVRAREGISPARITVIPTGKNVEAFRPRGLRDEMRRRLSIPVNARLVGWVGRLHPVKDLRTLIRAVGRLPSWWLLVVGGGVEAGHLSKWAAEVGLTERLIVTGETAEVAPLLETMDVFCLVSRWEGSPGALMEAMAAELPVVATSVGGVPEIVIHGETGLLVNPGNPEEIAQAILQAAARPELGRYAAELIRERFSEKAMVDAYEKLWKHLTRAEPRDGI